MLSGYRRAALFVDFDNIYSSLRNTDPAAARVFATDPLRWSRWLEEQLGAIGPDVDETTPRVLLNRTCYLNPSVYGTYRAYFTRAGFRVVDCPALTQQGKNSADIHMVIDALDLLAHPTRYDEFMVLSLDADFTALFQRLRSFDRRVIMLGSGPSAAALRNTCDYVIPDEVFISEALLGEQPYTADGPMAPETAAAALVAQSAVTTSSAALAMGSADGVGAAAPAVPPAPGNGGQTKMDPAELHGHLGRALREMVSTSAEPVKMAYAASVLSSRFGPDVVAGRWAGTGGFKAFCRSVADGHLQVRIDGKLGFLYDPARHDIDAAFVAALTSTPRAGRPADTDRFVGVWADAAARLVRVLNFPALLPSEWAEVFTGLSAALTAQTFTDMTTLERMVQTSSDEARSSVRFVGVGLSQAGYDLAANEHTARGIGECFLGNMQRLADNATLELDDADRAALREWLLGGLPPKQCAD